MFVHDTVEGGEERGEGVPCAYTAQSRATMGPGGRVVCVYDTKKSNDTTLVAPRAKHVVSRYTMHFPLTVRRAANHRGSGHPRCNRREVNSFLHMQDFASDTSSTTTPVSFDWSNTTPSPELSLEVRVPWREYQCFKAWGIKDVKQTWPCGSTGYKKEDQAQLLSDIGRFYRQPFRMDGDFVIVKELYRPPKSGFAGRLNSTGCSGLVRAIRSNLLIETCDLDMNNAQPRCVVWTCKEFSIATPMFEHYIHNRDGQDGMLRRITEEEGVSKGKAKQLVIITLTNGDKLRGLKGSYMKKLDAEAKEIQQALMARPELQWILPYCKDQNRAGSFMSHVYHFIESKLLLRVYHMVVDEFGVAVAALVFDGLNLADKSLHGDQRILDRAHDVCEEVCPGIRMPWAWKQLDFVLESNDKKPLTSADGSAKELRVPDDYRPPPLPPPPAADSDANPAGLALDPETQPTYEELRAEFSLNLGGGGFEGGWHGKVGSEFIRVDGDGKLELFDSSHFKTKYADMKYFEIRYMDDPETGKRERKIQSSPFIDKWMHDERMRARYIHDKSQRYCWERFDMFPVSSECPDEVYNIWSGLAAEKMESEYCDTTRAGLLLILEHLKMLCSGNAAQYTFMLNILAHAVQYPNVKLGIMLCLVGKQGCGKGHVWELIERMVGLRSCFTTSKPDKDVWGDNNSRMKDAFFCSHHRSGQEEVQWLRGRDAHAHHRRHHPRAYPLLHRGKCEELHALLPRHQLRGFNPRRARRAPLLHRQVLRRQNWRR